MSNNVDTGAHFSQIGAGSPSRTGTHAILRTNAISELTWKGRLGSRRAEHETDADGEHPNEPSRLFVRPAVKPSRTVEGRKKPLPRPLGDRIQTPPAVTSWPALTSSGNEAAADTQLGVSTTHVVVTTRTHIGFYNKAGQLQQPSIYVGDFFAPLGLDKTMGISTFFDTRSMFDPYRKRFWLRLLSSTSRMAAPFRRIT